MAAAQEERFSRKKHDSAFPARSIRYCLSEASISLADLDHVIFYDKPLVKFERLLETYLGYAPRCLHSFIAAMPVRKKFWLAPIIMIMLLLGALVVLSHGSAIAPFIYTLF